MKTIFYITIVSFFFTGCTSTLYTGYTLLKKHPSHIPELELDILNDTMGFFIKQEDESIKQGFEFFNNKRHFLIITNVDSTNNLVPLQIGDTIVYHKKELYIFNEQHKLVFNKD